ncbi:MAG: response regulator transcription factor [Bacteroidia bacterium]|jgi:two-component system LytT family response regulator|nr:response regulator transcription factor [Bacteroidia bacterium]MCO5253305.1 LytTR family DNA-binding domain-containing protein [Bacteroidota bacterium]
MLKTIIIDDEQNVREVLSKLLADYCPDVKVEAFATNIEEGTKLIKELQPDLVFLDVEFPEKSGFELIDELKHEEFDVIFISGHEEYALKAFKTEAVDYLLKPFNVEELEVAVNKVLEKRRKESSVRYADVFLQKWNGSQDRQVALTSSDGLLFVKVKDIIYCKGDGAYTYFYMKDSDRITVSKNLKEFEELLRDMGFYRVHKSYLINLNQMKKYVRGDGGHVIMSNGDSVDVSKRKKEGFLSNLSKV